ncbi:PREDICTED: glycogenin-1 [Leptosomus discolor]|uniref:glycogenin-1 n=1 Tax=Leptosomus discolor TaxID=188344 RepID=UPI000522CD52|nr:PREDICTED: glycogenin-1 [Leptosomus discolor]
MRRVLEKVFDEVILVNVLDSGDSAHLALMKRPELGVTLTKLHCWELTQFSKCIFMDADTMVLTNIDELFEREELSAAPDPGWPDCFNSGVFVYRPSIETYNQLLQFATEKGSFDGADQGLLNTFFSSWATTDMSKHLPFIYNLSSTSVYSYLPAFKAFGANTKVVHFLGSAKPWNYTYDSRTKSIKGNMDDPKIVHPEFLNMWWDTYIANVLPLLEQHGIGTEITTGVNMRLQRQHPTYQYQHHHQYYQLYLQKNARNGGNRAKLTIWEWIPLTTSRRNLIATFSRNACLKPW